MDYSLRSRRVQLHWAKTSCGSKESDNRRLGQGGDVPSVHFLFLLYFQLGHWFNECVYDFWLFPFLFPS